MLLEGLRLGIEAWRLMFTFNRPPEETDADEEGGNGCLSREHVFVHDDADKGKWACVRAYVLARGREGGREGGGAE
jgi:hypothetical protein